MNINTNYNFQANFTGRNCIKRPNIVKRTISAIKNYPNRPKTVVVLPDGTIDRSLFAKPRQCADEFVGKILNFVLS